MDRNPDVPAVPPNVQLRVLQPVVRVDYKESNPLILKLLMALFGLKSNKN